MMVEFILIFICAFLYGYFDAVAHSWTGKTLAHMKYKSGQEVDGKFAKGKFHTFFMLARVFCWLLTVFYSYHRLNDGILFTMFGYEVQAFILPSVIYGLTIALLHEIVHWHGINFDIKITCEKWGTGYDTDCIVLWLRDNLKINIWIVGAVIIAVLIVWYSIIILT